MSKAPLHPNFALTSRGGSERTQGREEKPHSQLAKARRRLAAAQKKLKKAPQYLQKAQRAAATHRERLERLQAQHAELSHW